MMSDIRREVRLCGLQLVQNRWQPWNLLGYLLGMAIAVIRTVDYLHFAGDEVVQICESAVILLNDYTYSMLILLGYLLVVVDSPFVNTASVYRVMRSSRKEWCGGMFLYLTVKAVLYYSSVVALTGIAGMLKGYPDNIWSQPAVAIGVNQSRDALIRFGLVLDNPAMIQNSTPCAVLGISMVLQVFYGLTLAGIAFLWNLNGRWAWGNAFALIFHLINVAVLKSFSSPFLGKYSLFARSMLSSYRMESGIGSNVMASILISGVIILLEILAAERIVRGTDYQMAKEGRGQY